MMAGSTFTRHREIAWRGGRTTSTSRLLAEESARAADLADLQTWRCKLYQRSL